MFSLFSSDTKKNVSRDTFVKMLAIVGVPVVVIVFYITASLHFSYTPDDTFIYLQFARNVIAGDGMSFNAGEPTYGFTSPLWLLLVSLGGKMGIDLYIAAKTLDLVLASAAIVVFFILAIEMIRNIVTAFLATIVFSSSAWFIRWAGSGMETSLAVLLVLLTFLYCMRNEYLLATVFTALLTFVRPEAFLLMTLILVDVIINSHDKQRAMRLNVKLILMYVAFLTPWLIYAQGIFGTMIPNTALAKSGLNFDVKDMWQTLVKTFGTIGITEGATLAVLIVCLIIFFFKKNQKERTEEEHLERFFVFRQSFLGLMWCVLLILYYSVTGVNVFSRYLVIVVPFIILNAFLLFSYVLRNSPAQRFMFAGMVVLALAGSLENRIVYHQIVLPRAESFQRGIMDYCFVSIGKWLRDNTPEGSTVVMPDIGAVGYFSQRKIFDTAGLISPEVIPLLHQGNTPYGIIGKKYYQSFCKADYLVHNAERPFALNDSTLIPLFTKMVGSLRIGETAPQYYSVYQVRHSEIQ
ncbi:MAG: hypothetical protein HY960_05585 [Ignavibacteriae bacterium]|nr:hypothetical protein [Ignavibacteriota bacterium]